MLSCSPLASAAGVRTGMRVGGVPTLCADCKIIPLDPMAAPRLLEQVGISLMQYTPEVSLTGPDTITLHVSASLRLFGGPLRLYKAIRSLLKRSGYKSRHSMAPTATGSLLLLHSPGRQHRTLSFKRLGRLLAPISCEHLQRAQAHLPWLSAIGCTNLGALAALPRAALLRRTSPLLLSELDQALGKEPEHLAFLEAADTFNTRIELYDSVEHASAIQYRAQRLIEQLCGWLQAHQLSINQLSLYLEHERAPHLLSPSLLELKLGSPSWCPVVLARLLQEHLNHYTLPAPVIAISLQVNYFQARETQSQSLFPDPVGAMAELPPLLDLLKARLGENAIFEAAPLADYRPEHANRWLSHPKQENAAALLPTGPRPFWLLPKPLPLTVRQHRPFYTSPLYMISGPERLEDGWWDSPIARDYFIAEAKDGSRYWIYQDLKDKGEWYLHGLFA